MKATMKVSPPTMKGQVKAGRKRKGQVKALQRAGKGQRKASPSLAPLLMEGEES